MDNAGRRQMPRERIGESGRRCCRFWWAVLYFPDLTPWVDQSGLWITVVVVVTANLPSCLPACLPATLAYYYYSTTMHCIYL